MGTVPIILWRKLLACPGIIKKLIQCCQAVFWLKYGGYSSLLYGSIRMTYERMMFDNLLPNYQNMVSGYQENYCDKYIIGPKQISEWPVCFVSR